MVQEYRRFMTHSQAKRLTMPTSVTWRVTKWEPTEDARWRVACVSEHPNGDWSAALTVAREWFKPLRDEIERGQLRIKVDPVNVQ